MNYQAPASSGDWAKDNAIGRDFADETVLAIAEKDAPFILGHTVKAMIKKGDYNGVEVGFFNRLSERLNGAK